MKEQGGLSATTVRKEVGLEAKGIQRLNWKECREAPLLNKMQIGNEGMQTACRITEISLMRSLHRASTDALILTIGFQINPSCMFHGKSKCIHRRVGCRVQTL